MGVRAEGDGGGCSGSEVNYEFRMYASSTGNRGGGGGVGGWSKLGKTNHAQECKGEQGFWSKRRSTSIHSVCNDPIQYFKQRNARQKIYFKRRASRSLSSRTRMSPSRTGPCRRVSKEVRGVRAERHARKRKTFCEEKRHVGCKRRAHEGSSGGHNDNHSNETSTCPTRKQNSCATGKTSRSKAVGVNAAHKNTPALQTTRRARADLDVTDDLTGLVLNELDANLG